MRGGEGRGGEVRGERGGVKSWGGKRSSGMEERDKREGVRSGRG